MVWPNARSAEPAATLLTLIALFTAACGGDSGDPATTPEPAEKAETTPEPSPEEPDTADASPKDVEVIEAWSDALRGGDVDAAAEFFAIPSVAENGSTLRITSRQRARLFNASLPCGAVLVAAESEGDFTTATFELTERPGPGLCGDGTGNEAQTAFVIKGGEIIEWRRVGLAVTESAPGEAV